MNYKKNLFLLLLVAAIGQIIIIEASEDGTTALAKLQRMPEYQNVTGTNINSLTNEDGETFFFRAVQNGHHGIAKIFLAAGADINRANNDGETPLIAAASNDRYHEIVKTLIDQGADVNRANNNGETPLSTAASNGYSEIVKTLIDQGADVNQPRNNGETPLMNTIRYGHDETVQLLLDAGADVNQADEYGETPLTVTLRKRNYNLADFLVTNLGAIATDGQKQLVLDKLDDQRAAQQIRDREEQEELWRANERRQAAELRKQAQG